MLAIVMPGMAISIKMTEIMKGSEKDSYTPDEVSSLMTEAIFKAARDFEEHKESKEREKLGGGDCKSTCSTEELCEQ